MKRITFLLVTLLFLASGCGSAFKVYHDIDPSADFSQFETYSFLEWTDGNMKTLTGMERERIRTAFARELESKGLEFAENDGDLKVKITVYFREAHQPMYGWYSPHGYRYIERALAVDMFETNNKKHIWHSAAVGEVERDIEKRTVELADQVQEMFETYPAR